MRKLGIALALVVAAALVTSTPAMAQAAKKKQRQRVSPHETITATIDGDEMKLVYGRPYTTKPGTTEARKIWGGLVPYGKVWRTGADEATLLTTEKPIEIGGYSLARRHVFAVHRPLRGRDRQARHQQEDRPVGHPLQRGRRRRPTSWRGWT